MATTKELKALECEFPIKVFCSTLNRHGKTRVTVINNPNARNMNDEGEILFQEIFGSWNNIPDDIEQKIREKCAQ